MIKIIQQYCFYILICFMLYLGIIVIIAIDIKGMLYATGYIYTAFYMVFCIWFFSIYISKTFDFKFQSHIEFIFFKLLVSLNMPVPLIGIYKIFSISNDVPNIILGGVYPFSSWLMVLLFKEDVLYIEEGGREYLYTYSPFMWGKINGEYSIYGFIYAIIIFFVFYVYFKLIRSTMLYKCTLPPKM